jgi:acetyl-CoA C-acetyltransferase
VLCGERALALADIARADLTAAELYSCFPAAIQSWARDLRLEGVCPLTVTGAMPFAGGPYNHFSLEGVARMVEVLRDAGPGRRFGLVANLSGIFGKQACTVLATTPNPAGFGYEDVTARVAQQDQPLPLDGAYVGPATIVGYTVVYLANRPTHAVAICDLPDGKRTVARAEDPTLLEAMTREEFCGRVVEVAAGGGFSLAS